MLQLTCIGGQNGGRGGEEEGRAFKTEGIAYARALRICAAWHIWRTEVHRVGESSHFGRGQWKGTDSKRPWEVMLSS